MIILFGCTLLLGGCANLAYYTQSVGGQLDVIAKRQPISQLLREPTTPPVLKQELTDVLAIRHFAVRALSLPDNASYLGYTDVQRPYVVWNVVATPAYALEPRQWCFPFVGCLSYRGYFRQTRARHFAEDLQQHGDDVAVLGVPAYSTLGWFDDPVLNTMIHWPKYRLAGLIFHELTHQVLYIRDDSSFNESFAATVEQEGVRRWLEHDNDTATLARYRAEQRREQQFVGLITATRAELARLYASSIQAGEMHTAKTRAFAALRANYQRLKQNQWDGYAGYDRWFAQDLNNAHLAALHTYREYVPAFQALLAQCHGDLPAFYAAAREIGGLPEEERAQRLRKLAPIKPVLQ